MNQGPIIVVDDDPDEQFLYQRTFEKLKISNRVLFFNNGDDAYNFLQQPAVDPFIILCDINMPVMNGLELRAKMCENKVLFLKNTPFIFLSASARYDDITKAAALYTHGFFQKESSLDKHETTLKKIIDYWNSCRHPLN
jgi:CheY-like chemotaxis protein